MCGYVMLCYVIDDDEYDLIMIMIIIMISVVYKFGILWI